VGCVVEGSSRRPVMPPLRVVGCRSAQIRTEATRLRRRRRRRPSESLSLRRPARLRAQRSVARGSDRGDADARCVRAVRRVRPVHRVRRRPVPRGETGVASPNSKLSLVIIFATAGPGCHEPPFRATFRACLDRFRNAALLALRLRSDRTSASHPRGPAGPGEMTEWSKVHDWKSCVRATVPRVRIPLSPPRF
jgi:hypothetical protein